MTTYKREAAPDPADTWVVNGDKWLDEENTLHVYDGKQWVKQPKLKDPQWTNAGYVVSDGNMTYQEYSKVDIEITRRMTGVWDGTYGTGKDPVVPLDTGDHVEGPSAVDVDESRVLFFGGSRTGEVYTLRPDEELAKVRHQRNRDGNMERYVLEPSELDSGPYWVYRYVHELEPPIAPF